MSLYQLLSAAGRQLSREKENWSVVSLLLRRVFISPVCVDIAVCGRTEAQRALCRQQVHGPAAQSKPLFGLRPFSSQKLLPSTHSFGVLPTPSEVIGAGKADFYPPARSRLSRPSPLPSPPGGPHSSFLQPRHDAAFLALGPPWRVMV